LSKGKEEAKALGFAADWMKNRQKTGSFFSAKRQQLHRFMLHDSKG
jgi:hypothetical protein